MLQADAAAEPEHGPKEAVPPWLARQQPSLADLFGASSSDEEQATEKAGKSAASRAVEANPSKASLHTDSLQANRNANTADSTAGAAQTAVSAAVSGLRMRTPQTEVPDPAARVTVDTGAQGPGKTAASMPKQRKQRIGHSAVTEHDPSSGARLLQLSLPSAKGGSEVSQHTAPMTQSGGGRVGSNRTGALEPAVPEDYNDEEEGNTPKFGAEGADPWDAVSSDEDAGKEIPGASSADSDGPESSKIAVRGGGATRGQNGSQNATQASTSATQEAKKPSIPESLKQALAAQVQLLTACCISMLVACTAKRSLEPARVSTTWSFLLSPDYCSPQICSRAE